MRNLKRENHFLPVCYQKGFTDTSGNELKNGGVKPIDGEEAFALLKAKTEAQRNRRS